MAVACRYDCFVQRFDDRRQRRIESRIVAEAAIRRMREHLAHAGLAHREGRRECPDVLIDVEAVAIDADAHQHAGQRLRDAADRVGRVDGRGDLALEVGVAVLTLPGDRPGAVAPPWTITADRPGHADVLDQGPR